MFEAVGFDDIDRFELSPELAGGEALLLEPDHVGFGEVDQQAACIFAEGHLGPGKLDQGFRIGGQLFH